MTGQAHRERNMKMACRWCTEGWAGNNALADNIFSESVRTNGVAVGVVGPKGRIQERLAGFPDLSVDIEDMFSADDKIVTRLVWRGTHTGSYAGIKASGKRVQQVGYLLGEVYAPWPPPDGPGSHGAARLPAPAREDASSSWPRPRWRDAGAAGAIYWPRQAVMRCPSHSPSRESVFPVERIRPTWEDLWDSAQ